MIEFFQRNKHFFLLAIFVLANLSTVAQERFHGQVMAPDRTPIPYSNVILLNPSDSTFMKGAITDGDGKFDFTFHRKGLLKITHIGYKDTYISPSAQEKLLVVMAADTLMLGEVVVKSSKPVTRIEGDALVTNVKGSILEHLGTAKDVLGRLPGVMNNQGSIEVFGKGAPAFYINGRLVRNDLELEQLKSEKIKRVEVVTNPGARYRADINAVIRISVERNAGEGFSFDSKTKIGYCDYLYGSEEANMNYRKNNLDIFGVLGYDRNKRKGVLDNIQNSWLTSHYKQNIDETMKGKSQLYNGQLGLNYSISSDHSLGVYYKITHKPVSKTSVLNTSSWIDDVLEENSMANSSNKTRDTENMVDGYYSGRFGKWTLDATFDLLWKRTTEDDLSNEVINSSDKRTITTNDDASSRLIAGEVHVSKPFWKGKLNFGSEYTFSRRKDDFANVESIIGNSNTLIKETNSAFYIETVQNIGKLTLQLGARYEHVNSSYYEGGKKIQDQSRVYDKIFPSIVLVAPVGKAMLQMSYSKKYNRPIYAQLSSKVSYTNRYLYESGNPMLRTSYSDDASINFRYSWFMLMMNYTHVKDQIITSNTQYNDDKTITLLKKDNSPYNLNNLQAIASFTPAFKRYYPAIACGILAQFYSIDYRGERMRLNNPMAIFRFNNMFLLSQGCMANADLSWRSSGNGENIKIGQTWQINVGITKIFNKHWNLKFSVNDIFNTARSNTYTTYSDVRDSNLKKHVNTRTFECVLRYNFNTAKSKYKGTGAGSKEKDRL